MMEKDKVVNCRYYFHGSSMGCSYQVCTFHSMPGRKCAVAKGQACPHNIFKKEDKPVELPGAAAMAAQLREILAKNTAVSYLIKNVLESLEGGGK